MTMIPKKKAYIVTGPESSGSRYISKIIAYVLGETKTIDGWNGYVFCCNKKPSQNHKIIILHRSAPFQKPNKYSNLNDYKKMFRGYDLYFIVCTRYHVICNKSKQLRFGRTEKDLRNNVVRSKEILTEIIKTQKHFIWNYETMLYLNEAYFDLLYDFLGCEKKYYPKDIVDGNMKYLK